MGNTVIAVYEADGDAERAFRRLHDVYNSNYIKDAVYGAVIDLPPSACYTAASDAKISETAKRCYDDMRRGKRERLFCALRPRRYLTDPSELRKYSSVYARFACENGALGAIAAIKDIKTSGKEHFYAYFGTDSFSDCDKLYFSGYDENGSENVLPYPNTIGELCRSFSSERAMFPKISIGKKSFFDPREGLYPFEACKGRCLVGALGAGISAPSVRKGKDMNDAGVWRLADIAFHGICDVYVKNGIKSVSDAALTMCAIAALEGSKHLGAFEAQGMSEEVFDKLKNAFFSGNGGRDGGEAAFLLTLLIGVYSRLALRSPEFHFLKNDVRDMARILSAHIEKDDGYGYLCLKENCDPNETRELSFIAKTAIWGAEIGELYAFLNAREGELCGDIRAMASIAVYAVQNAFREDLSRVSELEYKVRYLRSNHKSVGFCDRESIYRDPFPSCAEDMANMPCLYPLRARFAKAGCDISLLSFSAYLEECRAVQEREGKRCTAAFFADSAYPLVKLLLRASGIDPRISVCVITKDRYSHDILKKASSGRARLLTHYECSVKDMRRLCAVVRQITPYTVLGELANELKCKQRSSAVISKQHKRS